MDELYDYPNYDAISFTIVTVRTSKLLCCMIPNMDWKSIIADLQSRNVTLEEIAQECGFASRGAVHELKTQARQKTCSYEKGIRLIAMHRRTMRRKP